MIVYLLICYWVLIIEDISHYKTYVLLKITIYTVMDYSNRLIFVLSDLTDRKN